MSKVDKQQKIDFKQISPECLFACLYFACLPLTIVETPFGSFLKLVTMPCAAFLGVRLLMGKSKIALNYVQLLYALYIFYTIGQLIMYSSEIAVINTKDMVLGWVMLMLISMRVYNSHEKELIEWAWLLVGVFCVFVALTSNEQMSELEARAVIKIFGYEEDQNQFCAYFIFPFIISMKRITQKRKFFPLYIIFIVLILYSVFKTGSRGGLLGIVLGAFAYILFGVKNIKAKVGICISAVIIGIVTIVFIVPNLPESVQQRYSIEQVEADGGSGRVEIWGILLEYAFEKPERIIRGSGLLSTFDILTARPNKYGNLGAHNNYIQVFSDQGLIGLLLMTAAWAACLIRPRHFDISYSCAFIAIMVFSVSLSFYVFKPYINIMIMCAMSFEGQLPEDTLKAQKGENVYAECT